MGLSILVGPLAQALMDDSEAADHVRGDFAAINDLLRDNRIPMHSEPEELPPIMSRCAIDAFPYSFLHNLRRVYANLEVNPRWKPSGAGESFDPSTDRVTQKQTMQLVSHLLCHSDAEGYYIPIDFKDVLGDETGRIPGGIVCSSYQLREELIRIAPALTIRLDGQTLSNAEADKINVAAESANDDLWIERLVWLALFEAARLSIEHKAAICFC